MKLSTIYKWYIIIKDMIEKLKKNLFKVIVGVVFITALVDLWTLPGTQHISGGFILGVSLMVCGFIYDWTKK